MASPQTITGLTLLTLGNLSYATLVVTDPNGNLAMGTTPMYQTPSGILVPGPADANGYPIEAAQGTAPQGSGTTGTISSSNTATSFTIPVGTLTFGAGLFDAKQATVRIANVGTSETITSVSLALSDTVGGTAIPITYTQTVSIASGASDVLIIPLLQGIGATASVTVDFGTAPTAGSVSVGVDWQSAGAANTGLAGSLASQTLNYTDIPYTSTDAIQYTMLPNYNRAIIQINNLTNETLSIYYQLGITTYGLGTLVFNNGSWTAFNAMEISAGTEETYVALPAGELVTLTPQFSTAPTSGSYNIRIYQWLEGH